VMNIADNSNRELTAWNVFMVRSWVCTISPHDAVRLQRN
jgi:hypothetical protein